ncbi:MAG TPA: CHAT domain-containing protein [Bryobacteraceae bacterium]
MDNGVKHPSVEQLAQMVRGELPETHRHEIQDHLETCAACRETLQDFQQFLADCDRPSAGDLTEEYRDLQRRIRRDKLMTLAPRWGSIAAAIVLALSLSYAGYRMLTPSTGRLLAQANREQRSFPFRIAGAAYAPVRQERGGGSAFGQSIPLLKAQTRLAEAIRSKPDDSELLLLQGEAEMIARDVPAAVRTLERTRDLDPRNPRVLAALGAAYALRGEMAHQYEDYLKAIDALGRALAIRPGDLETVFNLALALERAQLKDRAIQKWEEYLKLDPANGWAGEARSHLTTLRSEVKVHEEARAGISRDPSQFLAQDAAGKRLDVEAYLDVAISEWLPHARPGEAAQQALGALAARFRQRGDLWLEAVFNAPASLPAREALARARAENIAQNYDDALAAALDAQRSFRREGNRPGELRARFETVFALRGALRHQECADAADALRGELDALPYLQMRAQIRIHNAICDLRLGRLDEAAELFREAGRIAAGPGFASVALDAQNRYLSSLGQTGLPSEFFAAAERSLEDFWGGGSEFQLLHTVLDELRDLTRRAGQKYASWYLAQSGAWAAGVAAKPVLESMAVANLTAAAQAVGERNEVGENLERSMLLVSKLPSGYGLQAYTAIARAELGLGEIDAALARLETLRADPEPTIDSVNYYAVLGEAYRHKGLLAQAAAAFQTSIDLATKGLKSVEREHETAGVLSGMEQSYKGMVAVLLAQSGREADALRTWRSFRALDAARGSVPALPDATPVLRFVELIDSFAAWFQRQDHVVMRTVAAPKENVAALADRFRRECGDPARSLTSLHADARQLYDWMIAPFAAEFTDRDRSFIVELDGSLAAVPVQALASGDGRYLGDRFSILVSSGYGQPASSGLAANSRVLVIANATVSGDSAARFPSLADSAREAAAIREFFPRSIMIEGAQASVPQLLGSLPQADAVHFAGHGYTTSDTGGLLFASRDPAKRDYEILKSGEIGRQDWSRCRLAVLSACATAGGEAGVHNPDGLVRALTRAGVSRVVASLWNVDSDATATLMADFYASLAKGESYGEALHGAQTSIRNRSGWGHPFYWAGFQLFGTT